MACFFWTNRELYRTKREVKDMFTSPIAVQRYDFVNRYLSPGSLNELAYHKGVVRDITFVKDYGSGAVLSSAGSLDCLVYTFDCQLDTMLQKFSGHTGEHFHCLLCSRLSNPFRSNRLQDLLYTRGFLVGGSAVSVLQLHLCRRSKVTQLENNGHIEKKTSAHSKPQISWACSHQQSPFFLPNLKHCAPRNKFFSANSGG